MRELKFKIWDKVDKKMLDSDTTTIVITLGGVSTEYSGRYELIQYTGMNDKNGKEIYEGDICICTEEHRLQNYYYVVEWIFAGFQLVTYRKTGHGISDGINQGYFEDAEGMEVVGNIYENPDMLGGDAK
jgi:uncharacterized phage protein (TIGR01671 family)